MRMDPTLTSGRKVGAHLGTKKILIYDATPHPLLYLNPRKFGPGTTPRDKQIWPTNLLKHVEQLPNMEYTPIGHTNAAEDMDTKEYPTS